MNESRKDKLTTVSLKELNRIDLKTIALQQAAHENAYLTS